MQFDDSKLYVTQCKEKQTPSVIPKITGNQYYTVRHPSWKHGTTLKPFIQSNSGVCAWLSVSWKKHAYVAVPNFSYNKYNRKAD